LLIRSFLITTKRTSYTSQGDAADSIPDEALKTLHKYIGQVLPHPHPDWTAAIGARHRALKRGGGGVEALEKALQEAKAKAEAEPDNKELKEAVATQEFELAEARAVATAAEAEKAAKKQKTGEHAGSKADASKCKAEPKASPAPKESPAQTDGSSPTASLGATEVSAEGTGHSRAWLVGDIVTIKVTRKDWCLQFVLCHC